MAGSNRSPVDEIEAIPENLFREPIDYLYADHFRQRVVCKFLDEIALDPKTAGVARLAEVISDYLAHDLPRHIEDEERDLFPLLRARCNAQDNIKGALTLLSEEHAKDEALSGALLRSLQDLTENRPPENESGFLRAASVFAETQRQHLAWEEQVVLPLARERLKAEDLKKMGRRMAKRRGASYPD